MDHLREVAVALGIGLLSLGRAQADCGMKNVVVETDDGRYQPIACAGLHRALEFLAPYGVTLSQPMSIRFSDDPEDTSLAKKSVWFQDTPASGYYEVSSDCVVVASHGRGAETRPRSFGHLPMTDGMLTSTVTHEVVHHIYYDLCTDNGQLAEHAVSEYLAYVVQIATMGEADRAEVLQLWPDDVLPSREAVNLFLWALNPPRFGVMSYRFHQSDPGLLRDILRGHYTPPDQSIPSQ